jgi:hypothetical protein
MYKLREELNLDWYFDLLNIEKVITLEDQFSDFKKDMYSIAKRSLEFWTWMNNYDEINCQELEKKLTSIIKQKRRTKEKWSSLSTIVNLKK